MLTVVATTHWLVDALLTKQAKGVVAADIHAAARSAAADDRVHTQAGTTLKQDKRLLKYTKKHNPAVSMHAVKILGCLATQSHAERLQTKWQKPQAILVGPDVPCTQRHVRPSPNRPVSLPVYQHLVGASVDTNRSPPLARPHSYTDTAHTQKSRPKSCPPTP